MTFFEALSIAVVTMFFGVPLIDWAWHRWGEMIAEERKARNDSRRET